jgi:DNA-binding MarR family transcriptional regulator
VLLLRTRRRLHEEVTERVHEAGFADLRPAHEAVFAFLPHDGARLTELARRARITKQSLGETVRELERLGYVRQLSDPSDGRAKIVRLTRRGRAANSAALAAFVAVEHEWRQQVGTEMIDELRRILASLAWV